MTTTTTYLTFSGNCQEAMSFYKDCLGGELTITPVKGSQMESQMPPEALDKVLHSVLTKDGKNLLFASDMMGPDPVNHGNSMSVCYYGDLEEVKSAFEKLSAGANVTNTLRTVSFGTYGDLTDKYGVQWMFQSDDTK